MKSYYLAACLLLTYCASVAQDHPAPKWQPNVQVNFSSVPTLQVSGTDSSYQSNLSISPRVEIRSNYGFGLIYSPYFVTAGPQPGIYMHQATVGLEQYDRKIVDLIADYSHFFFTQNPGVPTTPITNEILLGATYKNWWLMPRVSAGIGFGTNKETSPVSDAYDIELAAGTTHSFDWQFDDNTSLNVTPSVYVNAGTNEYFSFLQLSKYISHSNQYKNIVKNPHAGNKGRGNSSSNGNSTTTVTSAEVPVERQQLSFNNMEINLESTLGIGALNIRPSGSIYMPFSSTAHKLNGYWEVNLSYYF